MAQEPTKLTGQEAEIVKQDDGPQSWLLSSIERTYSRLTPRNEAVPEVPRGVGALPPSGEAFTSSIQPEQDESVLAQPAANIWLDRLAEYKKRKASTVSQATRGVLQPGAAAIPGERNWQSIGPTVVLNGQTVGRQPVAGRITGLAIAPGGQIVYAASAAGGVFRSNDAGTTWQSLMDGFDVNPTSFASASLVCGAIAIDMNDPNRIYVGTGEGDTHAIFSRRITRALPAYRGIGPIRSDDGGKTWLVEATADNSSEVNLAGKAFFALSVDPEDRENVLAATTQGLYQRIPKVGVNSEWEWIQRRKNTHSSTVVTLSTNTKRFFVAEWGVGVSHSTDGVTWDRTGTNFPTNNVGRIALGVQSNNPDLVYALISDKQGNLHGVYRLDNVNGAWNEVTDPPDILPAPANQGSYDLAIAVDPFNENLIYLGGSTINVTPWPGSIWRCIIQVNGAGYKVSNSTSIGEHAHADIHSLVHTPGVSEELWCGCDGGVFLNRSPQTTGSFASRNNGLACLHSNFIDQHPTDPSILFTGLQDNGTAQTNSGSIWSFVFGGDGGYCLINWNDPNQVLIFANGTVHRLTTNGTTVTSRKPVWDFGWVTMTQPIVGLPYNSNPTNSGDAQLVAVGAGEKVFISENFADSWLPSIGLPTGSGNIFALAFASNTRLFIGTTKGRVFQVDKSGTTWSVINQLDNAVAGPLGMQGLITDVAVDWADNTLSSIYVSFGGMGSSRRVWRFDGTRWESRSGKIGDNNLLDIEHNALVVDQLSPDNLYVGADIGVWHSPDAGRNWHLLENGLPDSPVYDLKIHPTHRLLRAATHGRGVYEIRLPEVEKPVVPIDPIEEEATSFRLESQKQKWGDNRVIYVRLYDNTGNSLNPNDSVEIICTLQSDSGQKEDAMIWHPPAQAFYSYIFAPFSPQATVLISAKVAGAQVAQKQLTNL